MLSVEVQQVYEGRGIGGIGEYLRGLLTLNGDNTPSKILSYIYIPFSAVPRFLGVIVDLVAELAKRSRPHPGALLLGFGIRFAALLDKSHPLRQDLPNHAAESMCDCPNGGLIAQPRQQTLWPEYLQIKDALNEYLNEATERIIREEVYRDSAEATERTR
jgi:hypothetical protein